MLNLRRIKKWNKLEEDIWAATDKTINIVDE